jgi:hypothetical protein
VEHYSELLACAEQEMIVRGARWDHVGAVVSHANRLRQSDHPLGVLPLYLTQIEFELNQYARWYGPRGSGVSIPFGPSDSSKPLPLNSELTALTESPDPANRERMQAAVKNWHVKSAGQFEVREFQSNEPITSEHLSSTLLHALDLDCLYNAHKDEIRGELIPPHRAMNVLFAAAANGGAYTSGLGGAYGRLGAWQSMVGLVNAPESDTIAAIADRAEHCHWLYFVATSDWFYQVCWDFGLAVVRPDGMSLAILAATDTD